MLLATLLSCAVLAVLVGQLSRLASRQSAAYNLVQPASADLPATPRLMKHIYSSLEGVS